MKIEGKPVIVGLMNRVTVLLLIYPKALAFSLVTGDKARLFLCFNSVLFMADAFIAEGGGRGGGGRDKRKRLYRQTDRRTYNKISTVLLHINKEFTVKIY